MAKLSSGKTFTIRVQNGHLWENFRGCMLVLHIDIADQQGHMTSTCWHFLNGSQTAAYCAINAF